MRLWSIHPSYLDRQGLLAVWRESLLAQKVLIQGEYKECACEKGNICVRMSLTERPIYEKCFNCKGTGKIKTPYYNHPLKKNNKNLCFNSLKPNPLFKIIDGKIESWEKIY